MKNILLISLLSLFTLSAVSEVREDILIEDFESGSYRSAGWATTGNAFGAAPAQGTWPGQHTVGGYQGNYLINTYGEGDGPIGTLTSSPFTIERPYINFLLGGGAVNGLHADLYVGDTRVCSSTPIAQAGDEAQEHLYPRTWEVEQFVGQQAHIVIVDSVDGGWGHLNADFFVQSDTAASDLKIGYETRITISDNYMQVPVNPASPCVDFDLCDAAGLPFRTTRFRLATTEPTMYLPVYVGDHRGEELMLRVGAYFENTDMLSRVCYTADPEIEDAPHPYRPLYHHSPAYGWMNDPNGMVYHNGRYHLFYQYYPYDSHWQMMHWGHAVSTDLIHWETLPIALFPDENGDMFSGSIVVDHNNTAGFGEDAFIAIYTTTSPRQAQSIAYSLDEGLTWHKYGAPVLWNYDLWDFRDPKVSWNEEMACWVMVLAANNDVMFFRSDNLIDWTRTLTWGSSVGQHGAPWECPDLLCGVPVEGSDETMDVLIVSINPYGPQGGSGTQYFIGEFQGNGFKLATQNNQQPRWIDLGKDNYAGVTYSGYRDYLNRPIFIGWMSNWLYAGDTPPADASFRSSNTFPRALSIVRTPSGPVLKSEPVANLSGLRSDSVYTFQPGTLTEAWTTGQLDSLREGAYIVEMQMPSVKQGWKLTLSNSLGEKVIFSYMSASGAVMLDRRNSGLTGFSTQFSGRHTAMLPTDETPTWLTVLVDRSSVELFVNGGRLCMTDLVFPTEPYDIVSLEPESARATLEVNGLKLTKIGEGVLDTHPVALESIEAPAAGKQLIDGRVVIIRGEKRYDVLGNRL